MPLDADALAAATGLALYAGIFFLPFLQEDAAAIAAATASIHGAAPPLALLAVLIAGLCASDLWKYWLGHFARAHAWAHKIAEKPGVSTAGVLVRENLVKTMFAARFIPGTRVPTYIACGFFGVPYLRYALLILATAAVYSGLTFALFHGLGAVIGEKAKYVSPLVALTLLGGYVFWRWRKARAAGATGLSFFAAAPAKDSPPQP